MIDGTNEPAFLGHERLNKWKTYVLHAFVPSLNKVSFLWITWEIASSNFAESNRGLIFLVGHHLKLDFSAKASDVDLMYAAMH